MSIMPPEQVGSNSFYRIVPPSVNHPHTPPTPQHMSSPLPPITNDMFREVPPPSAKGHTQSNNPHYYVNGRVGNRHADPTVLNQNSEYPAGEIYANHDGVNFADSAPVNIRRPSNGGPPPGPNEMPKYQNVKELMRPKS